jgi:AraC-like DNA-binding protein
MLARASYLPEPKKRWGEEGQNVWIEWEIDCHFARICGHAEPPRPERDRLLTLDEVAARLKCSPQTVKHRLYRERRQAAAADAEQEAA